MKRTLAILFILTMIFSMTALANSAEPPGFTIQVFAPPSDMVLTKDYPGNQYSPVPLDREQKFGEVNYILEYGDSPWFKDDLKNLTLIVSTGGESYTIPLPQEVYGRYNNKLFLDLESKTLTDGRRPNREFLLVLCRVILTLFLEGIVLYLFGYRTREQKKLFIKTNLITQGLLNLFISFSASTSYYVFAFVFLEILIFLSESFIFAANLDNSNRKRAVLFALCANFVSLFLGGALISYLPI